MSSPVLDADEREHYQTLLDEMQEVMQLVVGRGYRGTADALSQAARDLMLARRLDRVADSAESINSDIPQRECWPF